MNTPASVCTKLSSEYIHSPVSSRLPLNLISRFILVSEFREMNNRERFEKFIGLKPINPIACMKSVIFILRRPRL